MDRSPNRVARTIAQIRTGWWFSALYPKRGKIATKNPISAGSVGGSGCLARISVSDAPARIWTVRELHFGIKQGKMVKQANGQIHSANF
jgi:hypothetical protein